MKLWTIVPIIIAAAAGYWVIVFKIPQLTEPIINREVREAKNMAVHIPGLTVERIFASDHSWTATISAQPKVTLIATGDIIPARSVNYQTLVRKDFTWPWRRIAELTKLADITLINLETPLMTDCPLTQSGMVFCGDKKHLEGLALGGVDVVNLANNHAGNHGIEGVEETIQHLSGQKMLITGVEGAVFKEVDGVRFAFLGYNDITAPQPGVSNFDEEKMTREVAEARQSANIVVVSYHWGAEYRDLPEQRQRDLGHLTIDAGADLVIGNHPHWVQPVEIYKGKLITYAHGNTIFDQMWSERTKEGVIGRYTFVGDKLADVQYFPIYIQDFGQPETAGEVKQKEILDRMKINSQRLATSD